MLLKNMSDYFTKKELLLWIGSILTILISFILFKGDNTLSLIASLIGVTSLNHPLLLLQAQNVSSQILA